MHPINFDPESRLFYYQKLEIVDINRELVACAAAAVAFFAADLRIETPKVSWFAEAPWRNAKNELRFGDQRYFSCEVFLRGLTPFEFNGEILLGDTLDGPDLFQTIAHELRHVWQERQRGRVWRQEHQNDAEADADNYADEAVNRNPEYRGIVEATEMKLDL